MTGTVGIKEANGIFYPIVDVNTTAKKRLVLTTAHDNQKSVQIDLYKSVMKSMVDAMYIGSLVVENIAPKPKGKGSIEMTVSSGRDSTITVDVVETGNPSNEHHLTISLDSLEEDRNDYRDFDMGEKESAGKRVRVKDPDRKFPWLFVILGLALALLLFALWFFLIRDPTGLPRLKSFFSQKTSFMRTDKSSDSRKGKSAASTPAKPATETPAKTEEPAYTVVIESPPPPSESAAPPASPPPASPASESAAPPPPPSPPPVASGQSSGAQPSAGRTANRINAPQTIPPEGVRYTIRWGDTLWDISAAFYRNPRLYTVIARNNNISNPNRIVSGTELIILPRN